MDIYSNIIEANLANDDGGGLRFLSAGNFPYNVYNNFIVANISAHEGGGVAIDNAPNVRFYNNTVMNNLTTATAATSNGQPVAAGLTSALNNIYLQATLPAGSPAFSNPLMFNNIFWDNRAGTWDPASGMIRGIGSADILGNPDLTPINYWDIGVPGTPYLLSTTNSVISQTNPGLLSDPTNVASDPMVNAQYHTTILAQPWRGNPNFVANTIVALDVPVSMMGDYHLSGTDSSAFNQGAVNKAAPTYQQPPASIAAPTFDIDGKSRPSLGAFDSGADEFHDGIADLNIAILAGQATVAPGSAVHYSIVVASTGPRHVGLATVTDNVQKSLTGATWTCAASHGSVCGTSSGSGNIKATVNLPKKGYATFTLSGTLTTTLTSGTFANTATVKAPAGTTDPNLANNSAAHFDTALVPLPALGVLDSFNRANADNLNAGAPSGVNWSQLSSSILGAAIRINNNQAFAAVLGRVIWNGTTSIFGNNQGAAFTFANIPVTGPSISPGLILKASGGSLVNPANYIHVIYNGTGVVVATTNNHTVFTTRGTFPATFANGDTLSAVAYFDGTVTVYKTTGGTTTQLGSVVIPTSGTNAWTQGAFAGRIGMQLPTGARADNFSGGTVVLPGMPGTVTLPPVTMVYLPMIMNVSTSPVQ